MKDFISWGVCTIVIALIILFTFNWIDCYVEYSTFFKAQNQVEKSYWYNPSYFKSSYVYFKLRKYPTEVSLHQNGAGSYMVVKETQVNSNCVFWTCLYNGLEIKTK